MLSTVLGSAKESEKRLRKETGERERLFVELNKVSSERSPATYFAQFAGTPTASHHGLLRAPRQRSSHALPVVGGKRNGQ